MTVYTVFKPGGTNDEEFAAYAQLLKDHGLDIATQPRMAEPGTQNRWLHVWHNRSEAERFADELRAATKDQDWAIHQLDENRVSTDAIKSLNIYLTRQSDGITFHLQPESRLLIHSKYPHAAVVSSIFVALDKLQDFEKAHSEMWLHLAIILTGLTEKQMKQLGGFRVYDPGSQKELYRHP